MNMKRTNRRKDNLNAPLFDLNKSSTGCAPCLKEAVKIDEIKNIVNSIFKGLNNGNKEN